MASPEMREPTYLILTALGAGPTHGYALLQAVAELSGGRVQLKAGTLYAALDRLTSEGLITESGTQTVQGRVRRYYDLTPDGTQQLATVTRQLQANTAAATRVLQARGVTA